MVSAPDWDGTGCDFDFWQCRIYIPCSQRLRLLGSLQGSLGTYGLTQKLWKKKRLNIARRHSRKIWQSNQTKLHETDYVALCSVSCYLVSINCQICSNIIFLERRLLFAVGWNCDVNCQVWGQFCVKIHQQTELKTTSKNRSKHH